MYSTYKLNKQSDNIQPWCTPFPIWNQLVAPRPVLTVVSWPEYRFLRRQVRWSGGSYSLESHLFQNFPQFVVIQTVKGFSIVSEAEVHVFLEFLCFHCDPTNVGNLISGCSAFLKSSLYIWKFLVHALLRPGLKYLRITLLACEISAVVWVWIFFGIALLWDWNENWLFQSCGHCWIF